jgi:hypothetical protein
MTKKRKAYDWEKIEAEYRAGRLSIREIGRQNGISDKAIRNRAKAQSWERDLSTQIKEKVRSKLVRSKSAPKVSDEDIIEDAANQAAGVVQIHRKDIKGQRELLSKILTKLKTEARAKGDNKLKAGAAATAIKSLSQTLANLIKLEREAFNLNEEGVSLEDVLAGLPADFAGAVRAALNKRFPGK